MVDCMYPAAANALKTDLLTGDQKFYKKFKTSFANIKWIGDY
ncbi:MAG: hypothetical protein ABIJ56_13520 [Pseudomonadota bacterium]